MIENRRRLIKLVIATATLLFLLYLSLFYCWFLPHNKRNVPSHSRMRGHRFRTCYYIPTTTKNKALLCFFWPINKVNDFFLYEIITLDRDSCSNQSKKNHVRNDRKTYFGTSIITEKVHKDPFSVMFLTESGDTIEGGKFYLYELRNGNFHKAIYRGHILKEGRTKLDVVPKEGSIGFNSADKYYTRFIDYDDAETFFKDNPTIIKLQKSGIVEVQMTKEPFKAPGPFVVPYYRHKGSDVKRVGGIGILGLTAGDAFDIKGLSPGEYHIEIRDLYGKKGNTFYESDVVNVEAGKTLHLTNVELDDLDKYNRNP